MRFTVEKIKEAQKEFDKLSNEQKTLLEGDYNTIETKGIENVWVKRLAPKLFEIKTKDLRSLFKYEADRIIIIGKWTSMRFRRVSLMGRV